MVYVIIALNVLVFFLWNTTYVSPEFMELNFLTSWEALADGRYWTLLTSVFSHNLTLHILVNMFVLNSFGTLMEHFLGTWRFTLFYLFAGIVSSLCHCLVSLLLMNSPHLSALGASGAVAGLVLLFSLTFPREKILLFGLIPLPALFGALAFIAIDIWGLVAQTRGSGLPIGHGAHLGGALAGAVFYFIYIFPRRAELRP